MTNVTGKDQVEDVASPLDEVADRIEGINRQQRQPPPPLAGPSCPRSAPRGSPRSPWCSLLTKAWINTSGIATKSPSIVVTSASEMPPAIIFGSPVPNRVIVWKIWIMPVTVPSRPISGATTDDDLDRPQEAVEPGRLAQDRLVELQLQRLDVGAAILGVDVEHSPERVAVVGLIRPLLGLHLPSRPGRRRRSARSRPGPRARRGR